MWDVGRLFPLRFTEAAREPDSFCPLRRSDGQPELRQDDRFQRPDRSARTGRQLRGRHRREEGRPTGRRQGRFLRICDGRCSGHHPRPAGHLQPQSPVDRRAGFPRRPLPPRARSARAVARGARPRWLQPPAQPLLRDAGHRAGLSHAGSPEHGGRGPEQRPRDQSRRALEGVGRADRPACGERRAGDPGAAPAHPRHGDAGNQTHIAADILRTPDSVRCGDRGRLRPSAKELAATPDFGRRGGVAAAERREGPLQKHQSLRGGAGESRFPSPTTSGGGRSGLAQRGHRSPLCPRRRHRPGRDDLGGHGQGIRQRPGGPRRHAQVVGLAHLHRHHVPDVRGHLLVRDVSDGLDQRRHRLDGRHGFVLDAARRPEQPSDLRRDQGSGGRGRLPAADLPALPLHRPARGQRLHGPRGLPDGPPDEPGGTAWKELHPDAQLLRLRHSRDHGHADH